MNNIAIVSRTQNSSPRVLAESLAMLMPQVGSSSKLFYKINAFKRLLTYDAVNHKYNKYVWFIYKSIFFLSDQLFLKQLKAYDAIIISDCTPFGFFKDTYNIEKLRELVGNIPLLFYEVYYLGNAPTQLMMLKQKSQPTIERYDWHLSVTDVTEVKSKPSAPWSQVGLFLKGSGLKPNIKKRLFAVVDFAQPGFEHFRNEQIQVLIQLQIPYISLEKKYPIAEIRKIYQLATFYFMQSSEAFGLPIAECLCCGSYVFTPDSSWPMSWRLNEHPEVHGPGVLPDCFIVYDGIGGLKAKLETIKKDYDFIQTPEKVFATFLKHYRTFYEGNLDSLKNVMTKIEQKELN